MKTTEIENVKSTAPGASRCRAQSCESEAVRKIGQSISYMLRHLDQPLQVATLASRANISPSHFFALFKRQIGCAPIDYFIRLRMQHACRLLDKTVMSVKQIAATLGYDDPFYFSRIFKSVNQVAPSEYRLLKNGAKEEVRNCGITLHFFYSHESQGGLERAETHLAQDRGGAQGGIGTGSERIAGCPNGEKRC